MVEKRLEKSCRICGKRFLVNGSNQKYCSLECRRQVRRACDRERYAAKPPAWQVKIACAYCGKKFIRTAGHQKYCSLECREKAALQREQAAPKKEIPKVELVCPNCGKVFVRQVGNQKFCSVQCAHRYRMRGLYRRHKAERDGTLSGFTEVELAEGAIEKTCKICGKRFQIKHGAEKYCSRECRNIATEKARKAYLIRREEAMANCLAAGERICNYCHKTFVASVHNKSYCSEECRQAAYRKGDHVQRVCAVCGQKIYVANSPTIHTKTCSRKCAAFLKRHNGNAYQAMLAYDKLQGKKPLEEWVHEATACGMQYVEYKRRLEGGATYEELRKNFLKAQKEQIPFVTDRAVERYCGVWYSDRVQGIGNRE